MDVVHHSVQLFKSDEVDVELGRTTAAWRDI